MCLETITEDGFLNLVIETFCKNDIWKQVAKECPKRVGFSTGKNREDFSQSCLI